MPSYVFNHFIGESSHAPTSSKEKRKFYTPHRKETVNTPNKFLESPRGPVKATRLIELGPTPMSSDPKGSRRTPNPRQIIEGITSIVGSYSSKVMEDRASRIHKYVNRRI